MRRVVVPSTVLALVFVGSGRTLSSSALPGVENQSCITSELVADRPASDVLVIGTSRTGLAVDPVVISGRLGGATVEKIMVAAGTEMDLDLAYRTYVRERGVPRVLAVEVSFERFPSQVVLNPNPFVASERTATMFGTQAYAALLSSLSSRGAVGASAVLVRSEVESPVAFAFERLNVGWDIALRHPEIALRPDRGCTWVSAPHPAWVHGDSVPVGSGDVRPLGRRRAERLAARARFTRSFSWDDPYTDAEAALLGDLVDTALADGVERVVLHYLPSFAERPDVVDLEGLRARYPAATVFDGRAVMLAEALERHYVDGNHVDRVGAHEISVALAAVLATE